ncbi:MAG: hypothetical protein A3F31_04475 [Candidatus Levybacteria bacterium RIFCSPHIGHO2_12_FULL_38_12]|nr:MAG: hypothetical protein A2770_04160 [Candidatus Levybacteria bacterium RIFCSPHIGHO2_01_FULL_38_12]OGH21835.1 MAG: hypothetical protein A3D75_01430 [Candidatus Levybacteria bacterium RIFCSPHIGHO2_02_FULL_37_18]OGH22508.1 MAG: hypothetical protein A3F31_04475 [Candidatus Levybacteria bacterium RIFCSPHIGHO2_12_FULL_38_12]OGH33456.1 MAG: hypothetical protein A3A47_04380 [Candidatus Levybacteria bacterium RIFCSPLOWO2_01_FULL_37_20]OGH44045.1 MAG: hypothetical protein A3J14_04845 [Candidatus Lev
MLKKTFLFISLVLLLLLSLFPRSIEVLNGNPVFEIDQGRDYMAVKDIVVNHKFTLIGAELGAGHAGLRYLFHGPGYFYLLAIPFILSNGNPVGGVFLMLLLGLSTIGFGMYFVTKFWGLKEGFLMGFLLAVCPYLIGQSRFFENHFGTPIFILLVFYFTYLFTKNVKKNNSRYIFLASFIAALLYNLEFAISIPLCISIVVYSIFLFRKKFFSKFPFILAGLVLGFLPMILFEMRHGFMGIKSLLGYIFMHQKTYTTSKPMLIHADGIYKLFILTLADSFPAKLLLTSKILPTAFWSFFAITMLVCFKEKDKTKKNFLLFLLLLFPVNFLVFMLLRNIVFQHYITDLLLAFLFFIVIVLSWLYKNGLTKTAMLLLAYVIVLIVIGGYNGIMVSKSDYHDYGGVHKLKGKIDAIDFIYKDADKKPFGLFVFTPGVYTYPYDYLFWWHGRKKYGYAPNQEKKGTFYLLIEKDIATPWSYIGWKETVIKEGKVVFQKTLPSQLIVEKRIGE